MGQVYRATDTTLGRQVAIKILSDSFAADPERFIRFEREAKTLAALNHPGIAAIYAVEQSAGLQALVMELVEGEDLSERLARGPLPMDEALTIAMQIAEALEAAHAQGIVHRDLKPANIKVRRDGAVKVLDFGLAKAVEPAVALSPGNSTSPTVTPPAGRTAPGVILGTPAYMSPEQARGRAADGRTDIFAFGCVLYEMLAGRRAFDGQDGVDTLSRVLQREPDWSRLPADTPAPVHRLLRLCLEKDMNRRRQSAGDVRIDIEQIVERKDVPAAVGVQPRRSSTLAWATAGAALLAAAALAMIHLSEASTPAPPAMRVEISTPAFPSAFVLSPDGRSIAFVASGDGAQRIWLRALDKTDAQPLPGTDGANYPFWSPDSRSIGFFASGKIWRTDVSGGRPQEIAAAVEGGAAWNADGRILFTPSVGSPLSLIPASGGNAVPVTHIDPPRQTTHRWPHFLPDGRHFLFTVNGSADAAGTYLGSIDGGEAKKLTTNFWGSEILPPDYFVTVRQGALVAQKIDVKRGELVGDSMTLAPSVDYMPGFFEGYSVSATGLVAYRASGGRTQLAWFDRTGKSLGDVGGPDAALVNYPELSPDDRTVAVQRQRVQSVAEIWLMDIPRSAWARLTFDQANESYPMWSSDGTRVVFSSSRKGVSDLYWTSANGAGGEAPLRETPNSKYPQDWSRDGRWLLYAETDPGTGSDLWLMDMADHERKARPFVKTPFEEAMGTFSPDGRWVAYETNESGQSEIVVTSSPDPGGHWQVSTAGGRQPRWRPDGKELFFVAADGKLMAVPVTGSGSAFEPGVAVPLFQPQLVTSSAFPHKPQYAVARDGRFLINQPAKDAAATPITLLMNWSPSRKP